MLGVPHESTQEILLHRISICGTLQRRNEIELSVKRLVTNEQERITYDNNVRIKKQLVAKPNFKVFYAVFDVMPQRAA